MAEQTNEQRAASLIQYSDALNGLKFLYPLISRFLELDVVLECSMVKRGMGRTSITVGPYKTAVGPKSYAVYTGADREQFAYASLAAWRFIRVVGRKHARLAIRRWYIEHKACLEHRSTHGPD